jgi:hypothetical protein
MRTARAIASAALLVILSASIASADVQLSIRDGRVTLVAVDATVQQILSERARVGQTKIVNVERIPGGPLTLQFTDVPEQEALDILLRSVTGYMAAPRPVPVSTLSRYDRILVLATAAIPRVPTVAPAPSAAAQRLPVLQQPEDADDQPSIVQPRGPLFPTFQPAQPVNAQPGGVSATPGTFAVPSPVPSSDQQNGQPTFVTPSPGGAAIGTPRPGMVVQPLPPPGAGGLGQPGQPAQPPQ